MEHAASVKRELRKTTIYDLAADLGMSASTASRALDGSLLVSEETRVLVEAAAKRLGYKKRIIRRPKTRAIITVKLFIPASRDIYVHLFYDVASLIRGIQNGFGDVRVNIVTSLNDGLDEPFAAKKTGAVDAAVFAFTEAGRTLQREFEKKGIPTIHINRANEKRNYVAVDNAFGMETLLRRIIEERKQVRPCFIGFSPVSYISRERRAGVLGAASKFNVALTSADCFEFDSIPKIDGLFVRSLVDRGYSAVLCFNDLIAVHVYNRAAREGIEIPRDLALTGFDNAPILDLAPRRIDTINFSISELGLRAGAWLRDQLIERSSEAIRMTFAGDYVPGETIAP